METVVNTKTIIKGEEISKSFKIERRVRQGCLLALLLFVLSVKALRESIRKNKKFKRLVMKRVY
jgi:hypothetical protein